MIPYNKLTRFNKKEILYVQNDSTSGYTLNVDTEMLQTYGTYLEGLRTTLDGLLDTLNTEMTSITNGWKDKDGEAFKSKFSGFITESKKISEEINSLGTYAKAEASKYDTILSESIKMMGED